MTDNNLNDHIDVHAITCTICLNIYTNPVRLPNCEHIFCRDCITQWLDSPVCCSACPLCKRNARGGHRRLYEVAAIAGVCDAYRKREQVNLSRAHEPSSESEALVKKPASSTKVSNTTPPPSIKTGRRSKLRSSVRNEETATEPAEKLEAKGPSRTTGGITDEKEPCKRVGYLRSPPKARTRMTRSCVASNVDATEKENSDMPRGVVEPRYPVRKRAILSSQKHSTNTQPEPTLHDTAHAEKVSTVTGSAANPRRQKSKDAPSMQRTAGQVRRTKSTLSSNENTPTDGQADGSPVATNARAVKPGRRVGSAKDTTPVEGPSDNSRSRPKARKPRVASVSLIQPGKRTRTV
ncbi:hypothetical protein BC832DRAFT_553019 [Gaertneriomyces semiglobifer]|nr:hypothetical protein BC832DRAFT_553019 [Gaertneriomyces semiglobifer]